MPRRKKRASLVEVIGGGVLREAHAVTRTARRELYKSLDFMSGGKPRRRKDRR